MTKKAELAAAVAAENVLPAAGTEVAKANQYPTWFEERLDKRTGEMVMLPRFRYMKGYPKELRFNGKDGHFKVAGITDLGTEIRLKPVAYRIFNDDLMKLGLRQWIEIFGFDDKDTLCVVMFHNHSVKNFQEAAQQLFYDDVLLSEVLLIITASKEMINKNVPGNPAYHLADFAFGERDPKEVAEMAEWASLNQIYAHRTAQPTAVYSESFNYFNHFEQTVDEIGEGSAEEVK